jgi:hypothetical protein
VCDIDFITSLNDNDLDFVVAHEIFHLVLNSHSRVWKGREEEFNIAHDIVINSVLVRYFNLKEPPAGGLFDPLFDGGSAEDILLRERHQFKMRTTERSDLPTGRSLPRNSLDGSVRSWENRRSLLDGDEPEEGDFGGGRPTSSDGENQSETGNDSDSRANRLVRSTKKAVKPGESTWRHGLDVLPAEFNFLDDLASLDGQPEPPALNLQSAVDLMLSLDQLKFRGKEHSTGLTKKYHAGWSEVQPPWEAYIQEWFDSNYVTRRTFARLSRRYSSPDFNMPGRVHDYRILNILLDVSGSTTDSLNFVLGVIKRFATESGIEWMRIIQADTRINRDEILEVAQHTEINISGFGGSDFVDAMHHLAEDPGIKALIVITDGYIRLPDEPMPYDVLWCFTDDHRDHFGWNEPQYGKTVYMVDSSEVTSLLG